MSIRGQTYSMKKPPARFTKIAKTMGNDELFDKVVVNENTAKDDKIIQSHKSSHTKAKRKTSKKQSTHKGLETKQIEKETSPILFQDDHKMTKTRRAQKISNPSKLRGPLMKKKVASIKKEIEEDYRRDISPNLRRSETPDSSYGLIIEDYETKNNIVVSPCLTSNKKKVERQDRKELNFFSDQNRHQDVKNSSSQQKQTLSSDSTLSVCETESSDDYNASIEKARDSLEPFTHYTRGDLVRSPLIPMLWSDEDSSKSPDKAMSKTGSESGWVTISSSKRDSLAEADNSPERIDAKSSKNSYSIVSTDNIPERIDAKSSKYSYSIVSTYTEGTTSDTPVSGRVTESSPPVKMKKVHQKLNSTTCKGKDSIGVVEFPDSISPIWHAQTAGCKPNRKAVKSDLSLRNHTLRPAEKLKKGFWPPKCSTMLFDSEMTSISQLKSVALTSIHSHEKLTENMMNEICTLNLHKHNASKTESLPIQPLIDSLEEYEKSISKSDINQQMTCIEASTSQKVHPPKCPTLVSEFELSSRSQLGSVSASARCRNERLTEDRTNVTSMPAIQPVNISLGQPEKDANKNNLERKTARSSTPQDNFKNMSLSISPIGLPSFDSDELEVYDSIEVNSDEIIVPSFIELSDLIEHSVDQNQQGVMENVKGNTDHCNEKGNHNYEGEKHPSDFMIGRVNLQQPNNQNTGDLSGKYAENKKSNDSCSCEVSGDLLAMQVPRSVMTNWRDTSQEQCRGNDSNNNIENNVPLDENRKYMIDLESHSLEKPHQCNLLVPENEMDYRQNDDDNGCLSIISDDENHQKHVQFPSSKLQILKKERAINICLINRLCMRSQFIMKWKNQAVKRKEQNSKE